MYKRFEKSENMIQKHEPEIPENRLIIIGKNPNHERSENITKKLMYSIGVTFITIIYA